MERADWTEDTLHLADHRHPMDILEPEEDPEIDEEEARKLRQYDPELIALLLRILIFPQLRRPKIHSSWHRLIALAHCLHIEGIGDRSLESLANEMGCSRALLSWYCVRIRDFAGLDCNAGKSLAGREAYASATREVWMAGKRNIPARLIHKRK